MRLSARLPVLAFGALLGGCDLPHHNTVMQGNADWVIINYGGDVAETVPLARQHCAQYERIPVLQQTKDNNVVYACVRTTS